MINKLAIDTAIEKSQNTNQTTCQKPIFIVGAPRSGTTWLGEAMKRHPELHMLHEISNIWMWNNANKSDDVLTEDDLDRRIKKYIRKKFVNYQQESGKNRICDKTPRNCLRIAAIKAIFPDAKIIMLLRDGRSVINSTKQELNRPQEVPWQEIIARLGSVSIWEWYVFLPRLKSRLKRMLGVPLDYWGARPPGWQDWVGKFPPHIILAKQWVATMETAIAQGRQLDSENYLEISYEEIISEPLVGLQKIADFTELELEPLIDYAVGTADPSRINKWQDNIDRDILNDLEAIMKPTMSKLGYRWDI